MPKHTIFSVGLDLPEEHGISFIPIDSNQSLLDADIILFCPLVYDFVSRETYEGRDLFTQHSSFKFREKVRHWRSQLKMAAESGKAVFIFGEKYHSFFCYTGEKRSCPWRWCRSCG